MKILILSPKLPYPPKDGGAIATLSLAEGMADEGHEIFMLCLNTTKHFYEVDRIPEKLQKKIHFEAIHYDTSLNPIHAFLNLLFSKEPYNAIRFYSKEYEKKLIQLLSSILPDIVQIEGPYMGYYVPAIKKNSTANISLRAHNVEHEIWYRKTSFTRNPFLKYYFKLLSDRIKRLEKRILSEIDFLVSISERDQMQLTQIHQIKSITIPTGLNPGNYPEPSSPLFPSLFFIGALDWMPNQEGLEWFIKHVFMKLGEFIPGMDFHVAGRNAPEWLEKFFMEYKDSGIVYHGEVEDAYDFMNRYAIFISPLFSGSGIRIKILEGMIMKRAIVATSIAAEGIPVTEGVNIFIADTPEDMIQKIVELSKNEHKFEEVARNSRKFIIENFNTLATSKRLSEFYRSNLT